MGITMKKKTFSGTLECNIEKNPLLEKLTFNRELNDGEIKFYFLLDRYVYRLEKDGKAKTTFDSGFYETSITLKFSEDKYQFFRRYSMRVMSIHNLILGTQLPFLAVGVGNNFKIALRQISIDKVDEFELYNIQKKWGYLENDYTLLEKNISFKSSFQKSLIWYTMANQSTSNIEKFMCMYRCIEEISRDFYNKTVAKLNHFVKNELYMFYPKKNQTIRIPLANQVHSYLNSRNVDNGTSEKIIGFRHKIAHGEDYSLEYNHNLYETIYEIDDIIKSIINEKIKEMNIEGLKNSDFWRDYHLLINESEHKIALVYCYSDPISSLNDWNLIIGLKRGIFDKEGIFKYVTKELGQYNISVNENTVKEIIKNPGIIINY